MDRNYNLKIFCPTEVGRVNPIQEPLLPKRWGNSFERGGVAENQKIFSRFP